MKITLQDLFSETHLFSKDLIELQNSSLKFNSSKNINFTYKKKVSISVSSDYTTTYLSEMMPLFLANRKISCKINETNFGSLRFLIRDLSNKFWSSNDDILLLMPSSKNLSYLPNIEDNLNQIKLKAEKEVKLWVKAWQSTDKNIIQTTFDPLQNSNFGNKDGVKIGGLLHYIRLVNSILIEKKPSNVDLIDIEHLLINTRNTKWNDNKMFSLAKQPFSMNTIPHLCNEISSNISGILGLSKKVVVLDLDNTLWGGIIGDDGIENIKLGDETPEGESFVEFQKYLKSLSNKGIILCVCSKNNHKTAMEVFLKHKKMELKKNDISVFIANFNDKASNIKKISKALNLNLDSFLFIDDSNFECELVKKKLPEVMVINLSKKDPSEFVETVESAIPFYFKTITKEDLKRKESYKKLAIINTKLYEASNIESFLKSLKSKISIKRTTDKSCERSSQLISKTNQFKFNSNQYSSKKLLSNNIHSLSISFKDKFHDYGIISALVLLKLKKNNSIEIGNWVMSCRVFSRRIENYILEYIINFTKKNKLNKISFRFENTKKNNYLQIFLRDLGIKVDKNSLYSVNIDKIKNKKKTYMNKF